MGVVRLFKERIKDGEKCFPTCKCGETFVPLAIMGERPFLASLVCPACEKEVPVNNGYIILDENGGY